MDDKWQCGTCGARNDPGTAICYQCGTPRLIPPIPGTRVYDPLPEPDDGDPPFVKPMTPPGAEPDEPKSEGKT